MTDATGRGKSKTVTFWITKEALDAMMAVAQNLNPYEWPTEPDETGFYPIELEADVAMKLVPTKDPIKLSAVILKNLRSLNN